jgi:hypothetical protein
MRNQQSNIGKGQPFRIIGIGLVFKGYHDRL